MRFLNKFLMVNTLGFVILSTVSYSAMAKPPVKEKYDVLKQASGYAQSVACTTTFEDNKTTIKDVHLIDSQRSSNGKGEFGTTYVVYWGGDWGCNGGSGTYSNFLTSFTRFSETRPLLMEQMDILEDINSEEYQINTRFIEDVEFYNGVILVTASDYSDDNTDGGNNFPRYKYRYTLAYDTDDYKWTLVNKKLIKDNYPNAKSSGYDWDDDVVVVFE